MKFCCGLDFRLNRRLGTITTGHPHESKVDEWFHAARLQDFLMQTEDDFAHHVPSALAPTTPQMRATTTNNACQLCQEHGHFSRDCPLCWDVRHVLVEELDKTIMQLLAHQDTLAAKSLSPLPEDEEHPVLVMEEHFPIAQQAISTPPLSSHNRFALLLVEDGADIAITAISMCKLTDSDATPSFPMHKDENLRHSEDEGWRVFQGLSKRRDLNDTSSRVFETAPKLRDLSPTRSRVLEGTPEGHDLNNTSSQVFEMAQKLRDLSPT
ncbi:hypothetical protein DXG03_004667, partial [Asterophora parasitica]